MSHILLDAALDELCLNQQRVLDKRIEYLGAESRDAGADEMRRLQQDLITLDAEVAGSIVRARSAAASVE